MARKQPIASAPKVTTASVLVKRTAAPTIAGQLASEIGPCGERLVCVHEQLLTAARTAARRGAPPELTGALRCAFFAVDTAIADLAEAGQQIRDLSEIEAPAKPAHGVRYV